MFFAGWVGHSFFFLFFPLSLFSGNSKRRLRRPGQNINQRINAHKNINQHALALPGSLCCNLLQGAGEGTRARSAHTANRGEKQTSTLFGAIIPHSLHNFELCCGLFFHIIFISASLMRKRNKNNMKKRQSRRNIVPNYVNYVPIYNKPKTRPSLFLLFGWVGHSFFSFSSFFSLFSGTFWVGGSLILLILLFLLPLLRDISLRVF